MSIRDSLKDLVQRFPALDSRLLLARRRRMARTGYPDWPGILAEGVPEPIKATDGPVKVLIATSIGSHLPAMQLETVLAAALGLRGAQVEALLCDEVLPGCQMAEPRFFPNVKRFAEHGPKRDLCGHCYAAGRGVYESLGIKLHSYSDTLTDDERAFAQATAASIQLDDIEHFELDGLRLGEHAKAGALRFYARATIDGEPHAEQVLRRYVEAAILTALSVRRLLEREDYDVAVFHHGIYVPQGIIGEVARRMGVRVANWNPAYRRNCFIFSHGDTYHHTLMDEPVSAWEGMPWGEERRERISSYLRSRWQGDNDWIRFTGNPMFEKDRILKEIGCDPDRPIIACLTNVMWDAQLHYPANAFRNMLEWLVFTIRHFETRPDLQLVIRVHPAEIRGAVPTRQPVVEEIGRLFPSLPPNVFVVGPESDISTYVLAEMADSAIIYGTKTGVELTAAGIPVIVAGEAWIRGKGLTRDASSSDDYEEALSALPLGRRLDNGIVDRALRYADHFFFRRMIPVGCFRQGPGWPPYEFSGHSIAPLRPGFDPGLDCICEGILSGSPFVYDEFEHV
jgi:hypothetical protein